MNKSKLTKSLADFRLDKNKYIEANKRKDVIALREYIINSFSDLVFNEDGHTYFLKGKGLTSVSKVIERFSQHFDADSKAQECFEKYYNNIDSKYYHKTKKQILDEWKQHNKNACDLGHRKHSFSEDVYYLLTEQYDLIQRPLVNGNLVPEDFMEENVINYWNDLPVNYIPILCETKVYEEDFGYAGTFDLLLAYDNGGKLSQNLMIHDYKTNQDLFKNFNDQKMLPPFEDLLDCPFSHYKVQLNLYAIPLHNIKCKVIDRKIIFLNEQTSYLKYPLPDLTTKIINHFNS